MLAELVLADLFIAGDWASLHQQEARILAQELLAQLPEHAVQVRARADERRELEQVPVGTLYRIVLNTAAGARDETGGASSP